MRILLPAHYVLAPGGIRTYVEGLVPALRDALGPGDELVVASPRGALAAGQSRMASPLAGATRLAYEQLGLPRLAARCDTVHLSDARTVVATRTPVVLTVHDVSFLDHPEWFSRPAARYKRATLAASLARRPAAVVCDSEHTRTRLLAHHPRARGAVVIPPGVAKPGPDRPARHDGGYFLTVGAIEPRKNHLTLLRAFRLARARGLDLRWKIAGGPGPHAEPILAALRAEPGVDVAGRVSDAELEALYAGACFVAAPSWYEGFGYPALEAMVREVPVACAAGSGMAEAVGEAAVVIEPGDVEAWARVSVDLARDGELRSCLVTTGRQRVRLFDWPSVAGRIADLHEKITTSAR